jgi:hypothetical protein
MYFREWVFPLKVPVGQNCQHVKDQGEIDSATFTVIFFTNIRSAHLEVEHADGLKYPS